MYQKLILIPALLLLGGTIAWAEGMRFDHDTHIQEYAFGMECSACHMDTSTTIIPPAEACLMCHDEFYVEMTSFGSLNTHGPTWARNHGGMAQGNALDCTTCHSQSYCMECHVSGFADEQGSFSNNMINSHSSDFHITHPLAARGNQQTCASCHEPQFCNDCHSDFQGRVGRTNRANSPSHLQFFALGSGADFEAVHGATVPETNCSLCHTGGTVADSFHDWSRNHAREARRSLTTCQSCHPGGDVCIQCHSAVSGAGGFNPHGSGWSSRSGRLKDASGGKTCKMCHDSY